MKALVVKRVSFDAAHFLLNYPGKCSRLHGHHFVVEVGVRGEISAETGMVVDFKWLKDALESICEIFDHGLVNDYIDNPTAENIARYIWDKLEDEWIQSPTEPIRMAFVRVWETPDSYAEVEQ